MNRFFHLICAITLFAAQLSAETVLCQPGKLSSLVKSPSAITSLILTGSIDASDFFFIGEAMPSLRSLDISAVTIEEYKGDRLGTSSAWPAATIPGGALAGTAIESVILPKAPTAIGSSAFTSTALKSIDIPSTVTSVGENAFADCRSLTSAKIAAPALGGYTFCRCTALSEVEFAGCTQLGRSDFAGCINMTSAKGSEALVSISDRAFEDCTALKSFAFGKSLKHLGERSFSRSGLEAVEITENAALDTIGPWAFAECTSLVCAEFPETIKAIARGAFFGCTALRSITLHGSETGEFVLKGTTALEDVTLSDETEYISPYTFFGASAVTSLTLPGSISALGDYAMADMSGLETIDATALSSVPVLGENVFDGIDQPETVLMTDKNVTEAFKNAAQWQDFKIEDSTTDISIPGNPDSQTIRGRIINDIIEIQSTGSPISDVEIYDTDGHLLLTQHPGTATASIDVSGFSTRILIARCTTESGLRASLKLSR